MKAIENYEFKGNGNGRGSKYDFEQMLNGKIWQLDAGVDFTSKPSSVCMRIRKAAKTAGKAVRLSVLPEGKGVVVQAVVTEHALPTVATKPDATTEGLTPKSLKRNKAAV